MKHFYKIIVAVLLISLAGCASYYKMQMEWSEDLPPIDIFLEAYESDPANQQLQSLEEYLVWVKRFYQGWVVYNNGWLQMSDDLTSQMPANQRPLVRQRIAGIGLSIAPEWAKEKPDRYIFTNMVAVWGEALLEALERDEVLAYMDAVERDLQLLKAGQVGRQDISMQRYFPDIEETPFLF